MQALLSFLVLVLFIIIFIIIFLFLAILYASTHSFLVLLRITTDLFSFLFVFSCPSACSKDPAHSAVTKP